jgi:hypothetical protein
MLKSISQRGKSLEFSDLLKQFARFNPLFF